MSTRLGRRLRVALIRQRCTVRPPLLPRARRAELALEREARDPPAFRGGIPRA